MLLSLEHVVDGWLMVQSYAARIKSQTNHCLDLENLIKSFSLWSMGIIQESPITTSK
jgi:hypothetical protein